MTDRPEHAFVEGRCTRCGQTPWEPELRAYNRFYGRTEKCLTDEGLRDLALYQGWVNEWLGALEETQNSYLFERSDDGVRSVDGGVNR